MRLLIKENDYSDATLTKIAELYIKLLYKYDVNFLQSLIYPGYTLETFKDEEINSIKDNPQAYLMDTKETLEDILNDPTISYYVESDLVYLLNLVNKSLGVMERERKIRVDSINHITHSKIHKIFKEMVHRDNQLLLNCIMKDYGITEKQAIEYAQSLNDYDRDQILKRANKL